MLRVMDVSDVRGGQAPVIRFGNVFRLSQDTRFVKSIVVFSCKTQNGYDDIHRHCDEPVDCGTVKKRARLQSEDTE